MTGELNPVIHPRGSVLAVVVVPGSARIRADVTDSGELRLRVTAPPVAGAANAEVVRYLAALLRVPRSSLEILSGRSGRRKRILVVALGPGEVSRRVSLGLGSPQ